VIDDEPIGATKNERRLCQRLARRFDQRWLSNLK